jgi:hypothetical protein
MRTFRTRLYRASVHQTSNEDSRGIRSGITRSVGDRQCAGHALRQAASVSTCQIGPLQVSSGELSAS